MHVMAYSAHLRRHLDRCLLQSHGSVRRSQDTSTNRDKKRHESEAVRRFGFATTPQSRWGPSSRPFPFSVAKSGREHRNTRVLGIKEMGVCRGQAASMSKQD